VDRIDPKSGVFVNCMNCRHMDAETLYTCTAYPDGIPIPILSGDMQHDQPLFGDKGIQFKATYTRTQTLDSDNVDIIELISSYYKNSVDAILGIPHVDSNFVSGLFRSGYTVVSYRFDDSTFSWETWNKDKSQAFLRGYYAPDLSSYLPTSYTMGLVDVAIIKNDRADTPVSTNKSVMPKFLKSVVSLRSQSHELVNNIKLKYKRKT